MNDDESTRIIMNDVESTRICSIAVAISPSFAVVISSPLLPCLRGGGQRQEESDRRGRGVDRSAAISFQPSDTEKRIYASAKSFPPSRVICSLVYSLWKSCSSRSR